MRGSGPAFARQRALRVQDLELRPVPGARREAPQTAEVGGRVLQPQGRRGGPQRVHAASPDWRLGRPRAPEGGGVRRDFVGGGAAVVGADDVGRLPERLEPLLAAVARIDPTEHANAAQLQPALTRGCCRAGPGKAGRCRLGRCGWPTRCWAGPWPTPWSGACWLATPFVQQSRRGEDSGDDGVEPRRAQGVPGCDPRRPAVRHVGRAPDNRAAPGGDRRSALGVTSIWTTKRYRAPHPG